MTVMLQVAEVTVQFALRRYIKSLVERVPGIRYQLVGFVGPGPFLGQTGS